MQKVIGFGEGKTDFSNSIIADRRLDKLLLYPEKMLYGAGQGAFERFTRASGTNEVHSTLPGILFYYGAVPFSILVLWIVSSYKGGRLRWDIWLEYGAFFIESCLLANQRQPLFWMVIMLASLENTGVQISNRSDDARVGEGFML